MIKGIDVSSYQADTYATTGLDFAFVKATEGTSYVNPKMGKQAATARTAGLALGFYHFMRPGSLKAQAAYFVEKAASLPGDILAVDWEDAGVTNAAKDEFIREVKRLRPDHKVVLYCNRHFWLTRDDTSACGDGLWIADPDRPAGQPNVKHPWLFHQYSSTGGVDRNVAKFASRAELRKWAGYPAAPVPVPKPKTKDQEQDERIAALEKAVAVLQKG